MMYLIQPQVSFLLLILVSRSLAQQEDYVDKYGDEKITSMYKSMEENFADIPHVARPTFWHIPKAGGTSIQDFTTRCLRLVGASEVGRKYQDETLYVFEENDHSQFVNVDTTSKKGMEHAREVGFVSSGLAKIIFTGPLIYSATYLFDEWNQGSAFTIMRHPIDRAISMFYYLQSAKHEHSYHPEWQNMTLKEYAAAGVHIEHDWVVRDLINNWDVVLTEDHLEIAKRILKKKVWIGLLDHMEESIYRFSEIFGWTELPKWNLCLQKFKQHKSNQHKHPKYGPESIEWELLERYNHWDLQLYDYAVELFESQKQFIGVSLEDSVSVLDHVPVSVQHQKKQNTNVMSTSAYQNRLQLNE